MKKNPRGLRGLTALMAGLLTVVGMVAVLPPAQAAGPLKATIELNVLVLDDGSPMVAAMADRLTREGVPLTRLDLNDANRPELTEDYLVTASATAVRAHVSGIVGPNEAPAALSADERATLAGFAKAFGIRQVAAYTWPHPGLGLDYPSYSGSVDGMQATVTPYGAESGFSSLTQVTLDDIASDVPESYGYLSRPLAPTPELEFQPILTAPIPGTQEQGALMGVATQDGRETLVLTFASNRYQNHWQAIGHGVVSWVTRGMSTSYSRNYLSTHIDDVLLPDALWSIDGNCTIGDDCDPELYPPDAPGASTRMTAADATALVDWQQNAKLKLDMVFNAAGTEEEKAASGGDALESALLANAGALRWVNHTWSHAYLGCVQDFTVEPWQCAVKANGSINYIPRATLIQEIRKNNSYASAVGLTGYRRSELVTGEHSGLKSLPQLSQDNPNLAGALNRTGVKWIASDASREFNIRKIGRATTVPRYPMNIYYNTETKEQAVDEYNWIYTSASDGGSGLCEIHPDVMTCIKPLDPTSGFGDYIVPMEARIAFGHVLGNDPRPHYAHQSNLTGDGLIYPVMDEVIDNYRATFAASAPLVNPSLAEAGQMLARQAAWQSAVGEVATVIEGNKLRIKNESGSRVEVPVTAPAGSKRGKSSFGQAYGGELSAWVRIGSGRTVTIKAPAGEGFPATVTWPVVDESSADPDARSMTESATPAPEPKKSTVVIEPENAASAEVAELVTDLRREGE
ncbi:MAG: hypothetical protein ACK5LN_14905 [Propioniciclava sp.]